MDLHARLGDWTDALDASDAALVRAPAAAPAKGKLKLEVAAEDDLLLPPSPRMAQWTRDVELVGEAISAATRADGGADSDLSGIMNAALRGDSLTRAQRADLLLEQLLVDDPFVATMAIAHELGTSSSDESASEASTKQETRTTPVKATPMADADAAAASVLLVPEDEIGLTPLEIRRKRNRESMQRARQRQRDDIESMKVTVRKLEDHFQRLSEQKQGRALLAGPTHTGSTLRVQHLDRLEADYRALADASRRLKEEKFTLEKMFTEKQKTWRRLQQAMVDRKQELALPDPSTTKPESLFSDVEFSPISEREADAAVKRCYEDIVRLEKMSKPLSATGVDRASPFPPTSTFGWRMICHLLPDSGFFVSFAKSFPHVTPGEVMLKTWELFSRPEYNSSDSRGVMRMETLQVVNENAYVAARDVAHPSAPGKKLRTVFLRFRLQTEHSGYVIGRACMNPTNKELRALEEREANVVYGDYSSWIEFRCPADGALGCEVKFGAILAFNTQEDMQLRLINALMTTIMWETAIISPMFTLASSPAS